MRFGSRRATTPRVLWRRGDEPATARSPLRLRAILSILAAPLFGAGAVLAALGARAGGEPRQGLIVVAVLCAVLVVLALIDLAVLRSRLRVERVGRAAQLRAGQPPTTGSTPHGGVPAQRSEPARRKGSARS